LLKTAESGIESAKHFFFEGAVCGMGKDKNNILFNYFEWLASSIRAGSGHQY
jgi:hypothetical protein